MVVMAMEMKEMLTRIGAVMNMVMVTVVADRPQLVLRDVKLSSY